MKQQSEAGFSGFHDFQDCSYPESCLSEAGFSGFLDFQDCSYPERCLSEAGFSGFLDLQDSRIFLGASTNKIHPENHLILKSCFRQNDNTQSGLSEAGFTGFRYLQDSRVGNDNTHPENPFIFKSCFRQNDNTQSELSEAGFTGFEDLQDSRVVYDNTHPENLFIFKSCFRQNDNTQSELSEAGFSGFLDLQDSRVVNDSTHPENLFIFKSCSRQNDNTQSGLSEAGFTGFFDLQDSGVGNDNTHPENLFIFKSCFRQFRVGNDRTQSELSEAGFSGFFDFQDSEIFQMIKSNSTHPENPLILKSCFRQNDSTHPENPLILKSCFRQVLCGTIFALLMCCIALQAIAIPGKTDSLRAALANARHDTDRVKLLCALSWNLPKKDSTDKIQYALQALDIAQKTGKANFVMDACQNLGRIYCYKIENYSFAIKYFQKYEDVATHGKDTTRQVDALTNLVIAYKQSSEYAQGLECGHKALQLRISPEYRQGVLWNMGSIYVDVADFQRAMAFYTQSLNAGEENIATKKSLANSADTMQLAMTILTIGDIYTKMKEYANAIDNYDKAIAINNGRFYYLTVAPMMGKGAAFEKLGRNKDAISAYGAALMAGKPQGHTTNETTILTALSGLYYKTGDQPLAQSYADSALQLALRHNEQPQLAAAYIAQGKLNLQPGKYAAAVTYLQKAINIAGKLGVLETEDDALQVISDAYKAMNRPAEALEAYRRYISIRDSIYNVDNAKAITRMDVESQYTTIRISDSVKNAHQNDLYNAQIQRQRVVNRSQLAGVAALILIAFFIYRNYSQQKKANTVISKARDEIHREQQISEGLLLNILPEEVARELKTRGDVEPQMFDSVTVLFTDFKGFTLLSEKLSPRDLVAEINKCFTAFDGIMQKYGVEKIKTIGDSYMAAGGLPIANDTHPTDVVNAALEIQEYMLCHKEQKQAAGELYFEIRIGIHTGPVVAGVVGVKKFAYDIWGDTVNTASRMESSGEVSRVNISGATYELVKDKFNCNFRGEVEAKNKGRMKMYFVEPVAIAIA